jgi:hypothetical protein
MPYFSRIHQASSSRAINYPQIGKERRKEGATMGLINRFLFSIITCTYKKPWQDCKCFTITVAEELSWDC